MSDVLNQNITLDCIGLRCPLPILRFRKAAQTLLPGQKIWLLSDDPNTHRDFPDFCRAAGHRLLEIGDGATGWRFLVQAGCAAEGGGE
ncbi:MAG: sulfurtransferase TusA family protein [Elstera sp.]